MNGTEVSCDFGVMLTNTVVKVTIVANHTVSGMYTNVATVLSIEGDRTVNDNVYRSAVAVATDVERTLNIRLLSIDEAEISWSASTVPFQLQYLGEFGNPDVTWSNSTTAPIESDGVNRLTNEVSEPAEFYRLIFPAPED